METEPPEGSAASKYKFPLADRALTIILGVILVDLFILSPVAEALGGTRHWSDLVLAVGLLLGVIMLWGNLWIADLFVATCIASIGLSLGVVFKLWSEQPVFASLLSCANFLILGALIGRQVFAPGRISLHRVQGAVAVYLLAGLLFSQVFRLISISYPGSFLLLGQPATHEQITSMLTYFSFVALTTTGFGDVSPVHPLARSFTVLASVFGTLYPAILIGKLVSQELMGQENR